MTILTLSERLEQGLDHLGLVATPLQIKLLLQYQELITQWNKVYNLTAIKDSEEMLTHHILDSLAVIPYLLELTAQQPMRLMDVGSGAGLPGVIIATMCPHIDVSCVDTVAKKAAFITQASLTLQLKNLHGIHARVEQYKSEIFDVVCSRAFASLADFTQLTMFHVKQNTGFWFALKGKFPEEELKQLPPSINLISHKKINVPFLNADRCVLVLKKTV